MCGCPGCRSDDVTSGTGSLPEEGSPDVGVVRGAAHSSISGGCSEKLINKKDESKYPAMVAK